jgi:F0F1-type ATP synthase assembly protein I
MLNSKKSSSFKEFLSKPLIRDSKGLQYSSLGIQLTATILILLFIGIKIDEWLNTGFIFTLLCTLIGFIGGFYSFYLNIQKLSKNEKKEKLNRDKNEE